MSTIFTQPFGAAIGLGADCRVRYQLSLARHKRRHPDALVIADYERALYASNRELQPDGTFPFDWWVTPFPALLKCVREDFAGLFARERLAINPTGSVFDTGYGITFPHAFSRAEGKVTPELLDAEYETQRAKVEYLIGKFRHAATTGVDNLYVVCGGSTEQARTLRPLLADLGQRPHLLCVQLVEETKGVTLEEDGLTIYEMSRENSKPDVAKWQGDNAHWGELLDRIHFH